MPGFFSVLNKFPQKHSLKIPAISFKERMDLSNTNYHAAVFSTTNNKFLNDKLFVDSDDYMIILDGAIFNKVPLMEHYKMPWDKIVIYLYRKFGNTFIKELIGTFTGVFLDKKKNKWLIFNDPIGDKPLFVFKSSDCWVFSTDIDPILTFFQVNNIRYSLDELSAYMLLTYGYQIENFTMFSEIKKFKPGHYVSIENDIYIEESYFHFTNSANYKLSDKETIETIDHAFKTAIKRQYGKNDEYNYRHLAALSGGLDSRMTNWVANKMGYSDVLNFTFSQSDYWDETIPKAISSDLKNEWIFKSLDNGLFLKSELEEVIKLSHGSALYYGLAHCRSMLKLIDMNDFGIIHSGQLGDAVVGSFYSKSAEINDENDFRKGAYSQKLLFKIENDIKNFAQLYDNNELFRMYSRGFAGANQGLLNYQEKAETFSPFYDIDFMKLCFSIPQEKRMNHYIYYKWIDNKYKDAGDYVWEKMGTKINSFYFQRNQKRYYFNTIQKKLKNRALQKLGFKLDSGQNSKKHMNPLDYWYNTNTDLKTFLDTYFETNIALLKSNKALHDDAIQLYQTGNNIEKNQVITLLAFMKIYFS